MDANEHIAKVIDEANYLEMRIGHLLSHCIRPVNSEYGFLVDTALHNTVMSFGAKVLLLKRILDYWSWDDLQKHSGRFDDVLRMRNAFAHTPTARRQLVVDANDGTVIDNEMIVETKEGRRLENIERGSAFARFRKAYNSSLELFEQIDARVKETIA
ncbi:MAG: hypothetical protein U9R43_15565 [Thermodesulfobacteriota bacterium]|nr:hypothetical protein [Thermodesulfobacteriota bacterium]